MAYNLKDHGDLFEKQAVYFIREKVPNYEKIWQIYIGNKGNDTKAEIPGYPAPRDTDRQIFSEHTYTVLLSILSMKRIFENDTFQKKEYGVNEILSIHDSLLLFFGNMGKIRDNLSDAGVRISITRGQVENSLEEFWNKRHIPIHGRTIPLVFKSDGTIEMPKFPEYKGDSSGWNYKTNNWDDVTILSKEEAHKMISETFTDFLGVVNNIFGDFFRQIEKELKDTGCSIKFESTIGSSSPLSMVSSGVTSTYGITSKDGTKGSGGYGGMRGPM